LFLAATAPFLWHYLAHQEVGTAVSARYSEIHRIIESRFQPGYLDLPRAFIDFVLVFTAIRARPLFWVWASIGALLVASLRRKDPRSVFLVFLWILGLLITSMLLPLIDHGLARAFQSFPLEYDLVRGLRYLVPFMLLFSLWPLAEIGRRSSSVSGTRVAAFVIASVGAMLVAVWSYWHPPLSVSSLARCWSRGRLACGPSYDTAFEALDAIRRLTPPQAAILPTDLPLAIRYFSLRPVVHCYKDGGILAYADHEKLMQWNETKRAMSRALLVEDPDARMRRLADLARELGAAYLFVGTPLTDAVATSRYKLIWANKGYALVALDEHP
jgi:hypothetical protein